MVVWGLGSWIGLLRLGFSADGVKDLWCEAFWSDWGWGYLNKHRRITLGKNFGQIMSEKEFSPNLFLESLCDLVSQ